MTADVFERHVRRFDEVLGFLERLAETPWERFRGDPEKFGSAERFLQAAVDVLNDLGAQLVARSGGEPAGSYRDVPRRLLESGVLDEAQADVWRRVIGFRNGLPRSRPGARVRRAAAAAWRSEGADAGVAAGVGG